MDEGKSWDEETQDHVDRVAYLCGVFARKLFNRAKCHDTSKFSPEEAPAFRVNTPKLRKQTFLGPEYEESLKKGLNEALDHHYLHNRHHPQHFTEGIRGMNLVDLVEMILDWIAASERHDDGDPIVSVDKNSGRFSIPPTLSFVLKNTVHFMRKQDEQEEKGTVSRDSEAPDQVHHFWQGWGSVALGTGGDAGVRAGSGEENDA